MRAPTPLDKFLPALALGVGLALAVVILQEVLARVLVRVPNPAPLFFVAVVYATYAGGWVAGTAAALVSLAYTSGIILSVPGIAPDAQGVAVRIAVLVPSLAAVVALVHLLKRRADRMLHSEREAQQQRERAQALEHSRQLADTLAALDEVVWSTTADSSRVLSVSGAAQRLYGYPAEQFLREPDLWQRLIVPEDRPAVMDAFMTIEAKGAVDMEYRIVRSDGAMRRVRDRAHLSRDAAGRPLRLDGVVMDITAEREAQARLRRLTNLYAALSECNQAIVRIDDPEQLYRDVCRIAVDFGGLRMAWMGRVEDGHLRAVASFGARIDYAAGADIALDAAQPAQAKPAAAAVLTADHVVCNDIEHAAETQAWRAAALECGFRSAAAFPIRQGGQIWGCLALHAAEPGFFDEQLLKLLDEMAGDVSFALDRFHLQADRQRVTEALRSAEERWQYALEGADTGVWDWNVASGKVFYSRRWKAMLGYAEGEIGDTWEEWASRLHPDDREICIASVDSHLSGASAGIRMEHRLRTKDGDYRWILSQGKAMAWAAGGRALRVIGTHTDITQRKRAEAEILRLNAVLEQRVAERTAQLEASNRDLESFSYTVSHDLRAPLRAINGFTSLLAESEAGRLTPDGRALLDRVVSNTRKMSQLIDDILEYSRVGRAQLTPVVIDLGRLVDEVVAELQPAFPDAQVHVGAMPPATADPAMMRQVFANLIGNALKFSAKAAAPRLEIGSREVDGATEYFVQDNGAGFDMRYADKLFGMFQRMHGTTEFAGTGVGLAIVKRLVERHGGSIMAEAAPGQGATFRFTLGG
jgi:PAS domain S-box-containing protein